MLITGGTSVREPDLLGGLAASVAKEGFEVVVTVTPGMLPGSAGVHEIGFVPLARLLPELDTVVCTGGMGTVQAALAAGVPMVLRPVLADQPWNAERVARAGAGLVIEDAAEAGVAVRAVLTEPRYRAAAQAAAAAIRSMPTPAAALASLLVKAGTVHPGVTAAGQLVVGAAVVGVDGADDAAADVAQLPGLGLGQRVEDQAADLLDVAGGGLGYLRQALVGQDRQGVAAVGRVGGAARPAVLLQPGGDLGQARQRALGHRREFAHPQGAAGCLRQQGHYLVLEVADAGVAAQLRVERGRQPVQRAGQGEPGLSFLGVEPAGLLRGVHEDRIT